VDTQNDMGNCGACGDPCDPLLASECTGGTCTCRGATVCLSTYKCCPGTGCRNIASDTNNCGDCEVQCDAGFSCVAGECTCGGTTCDPGYGCCTGSCRDIQNDPTACGDCTTRCGTNAPQCVEGSCVCEGDPPCTNCGFLACATLEPPGPYTACTMCCPARGCVPQSDTDCGSCGELCLGSYRCEPVIGPFVCNFDCVDQGFDIWYDWDFGWDVPVDTEEADIPAE
jgi:hypothetical protein